MQRLSGAGIEQVAVPFRQGLGPVRQAKGRSGGAVGMGNSRERSSSRRWRRCSSWRTASAMKRLRLATMRSIPATSSDGMVTVTRSARGPERAMTGKKDADQYVHTQLLMAGRGLEQQV